MRQAFGVPAKPKIPADPTRLVETVLREATFDSQKRRWIVDAASNNSRERHA